MTIIINIFIMVINASDNVIKNLQRSSEHLFQAPNPCYCQSPSYDHNNNHHHHHRHHHHRSCYNHYTASPSMYWSTSSSWWCPTSCCIPPFSPNRILSVKYLSIEVKFFLNYKFSDALASLALMIVCDSLTDWLIETGDWQFCMSDSYFTIRLVQSKL